DTWKGLGVYTTSDLVHWDMQPELLLAEPGTGEDDKVIGQHPDVVVQGNKAYLFYFTHPGRRTEVPDSLMVEKRRSSIQVNELFLAERKLTCNRDNPVIISLNQ
ncbi:MAG: hypothetical protein JW798_06405, partial [Prolixibacteraceae bacterium]|nr:hypothetical protein [Prolixibacteraceae bacterium]